MYHEIAIEQLEKQLDIGYLFRYQLRVLNEIRP